MLSDTFAMSINRTPRFGKAMLRYCSGPSAALTRYDAKLQNDPADKLADADQFSIIFPYLAEDHFTHKGEQLAALDAAAAQAQPAAITPSASA